MSAKVIRAEAHNGKGSPLDDLIERLRGLPGVGKKSAERMAYQILRWPRQRAVELAEAILAARERIKSCSVCGGFSETEKCSICSDPGRDHSTICVVEMPHDAAHIERTGQYRGVYHVLMGRLSPLEGIGPKDIRVHELLGRVAAGGVREVILATNPTAEGDATAAFLAEKLRTMKVRVTRPARGLPAGTAIEYTDPGLLGEALKDRRETS